MANLSLFGKPFTELDSNDQLMLIKNARHLRRQRLPEVVRKAKVAKPKTVTKKKRLTQKLMFDSTSAEEQLEMLQKLLAKKKGD